MKKSIYTKITVFLFLLIVGCGNETSVVDSPDTKQTNITLVIDFLYSLVN